MPGRVLPARTILCPVPEMSRDFQVGEWLARTGLNELCSGSRCVHIEPKVMQVLACLARRPGNAVTKEEILQEVWPDTFVTEIVLWHSIWELRRIFGDDKKSRRYIQTLHKSGYRLLASVTWLNGSKTEPGGNGITSTESPLSIAVLPLVDMTPDKNLHYFCEGIAEEIISALSCVEGLHVVARTSSFRVREEADVRTIGRLLGVRLVLEGSLRVAGESWRITLQLIDAVNGFHLWSERYEVSLDNSFDLHDRVSEAVVRRIRQGGTPPLLSCSPARRCPEGDAHTLWLKGRYHISKHLPEGFQRAIQYFEAALTSDPGYAMAYASLADCYALPAIMAIQPPRPCFPKAKAMALKALDFDEALADAHATLAGIAFHFERDWPRAEQHLSRAVQLNPSCSLACEWYGLFLTVQGRGDDGLAWAKRALDVDPLSPGAYLAYGWCLYLTRRFEQALEIAFMLNDLEPGLIQSNFILSHVYAAMGSYEKASEACLRGLAVPGSTIVFEALNARMLALSGDKSGAHRLLERLLEQGAKVYVSSYFTAAVYAALDQMEDATNALEKAIEERSSFAVYLSLDPAFDPLRQYSSFAGLLRSTGLV